jgi:hypothetical protein
MVKTKYINGKKVRLSVTGIVVADADFFLPGLVKIVNYFIENINSESIEIHIRYRVGRDVITFIGDGIDMGCVINYDLNYIKIDSFINRSIDLEKLENFLSHIYYGYIIKF